jgi:hypothetical protein
MLLMDHSGILVMQVLEFHEAGQGWWSFDGGVAGTVQVAGSAPATVPEPTPVVLVAIGLGMVGLMSRRVRLRCGVKRWTNW